MLITQSVKVTNLVSTMLAYITQSMWYWACAGLLLASAGWYQPSILSSDWSGHGNVVVGHSFVPDYARMHMFSTLTAPGVAGDPTCSSISQPSVRGKLECVMLCIRDFRCRWFSFGDGITGEPTCYLHQGFPQNCQLESDVTPAFWRSPLPWASLIPWS